MSGDALTHVRELLHRYARGVHTLAPPADTARVRELPPDLAAFYLQYGGGDLFHESLAIRPAARLERTERGWLVAEHGRDEIYVDDDDAVWRLDGDSGDLVHDGTSFSRWLLGWLDGESVLYDSEGEFLEFAVDKDGELTPAAELDRARRVHKRDRKAAGPRWRLARALARSRKMGAARDELEAVVADHPQFPWAWFDLARISEGLGELEGAIDEAVAAAEAQPDYPHAAYFLAYAAKLAAAAEREDRRAALAERALALDPDLPRTQRAGAAQQLADENPAAARTLLDVALALAPRDLESLELARQIDTALE